MRPAIIRSCPRGRRRWVRRPRESDRGRARERHEVEQGEGERQQVGAARVQGRQAAYGVQQHVVMEAHGVQHEDEREQERGGAEGGERELGSAQTVTGAG